MADRLFWPARAWKHHTHGDTQWIFTEQREIGEYRMLSYSALLYPSSWVQAETPTVSWYKQVCGNRTVTFNLSCWWNYWASKIKARNILWNFNIGAWKKNVALFCLARSLSENECLKETLLLVTALSAAQCSMLVLSLCWRWGGEKACRFHILPEPTTAVRAPAPSLPSPEHNMETPALGLPMGCGVFTYSKRTYVIWDLVWTWGVFQDTVNPKYMHNIKYCSQPTFIKGFGN